MTSLEEIQHILERLDSNGRFEIYRWLGKLLDGPYSSPEVREARSAAYGTANPPFMTFEEFLEFAEHSPLRYEYVNGVVHAMTGPSLAHCQIAGELFAAVRAHLRGGPCKAFGTGANLQIRSETDEIMYIPDLVVACNPQEWDAKSVCNPKLVAEILSPSTRHIDLREKIGTYRRVNSIEEYVLLEQSEHKITVFRRAEKWKPQVYSGSGAVVELRSISLSLPLTLIYEGTLSAG